MFLDAILSAKTAQAKGEGIAVLVKANVPDALTLSDVELCIVVANLLHNAIEVCREAGKGRKREVFSLLIRAADMA